MKKFLTIFVILIVLAALLLTYKLVVIDKLFVSVNIDRPILSQIEDPPLSFVHWDSFPKKIFSTFSEKYPNIKVEFEQLSSQQYSEQIRVRMSSGERIDVMGIKENEYEKFSRKGYLVELTRKDFIQRYKSDTIINLTELNSSGKIFAIAYKDWVMGIWYNRVLFEKYFLKVPHDYREFIEVCRLLKANGVSPMVMGCRDDWVSSNIYYTSIWSAAGVDKNWFRGIPQGSIKWTDPKILSSFQKVEQFINKDYLYKDSINLTYHQAFSEFINGKAAMCLTGDWSVDMCEPGIEEVIDLGVFPIPYNSKGEKQLVPGTKAGCLIGIYSESSYKKEAEDFLDYLSQTEVAQYFSEQTKSNSTVIGVSTKGISYNELWEPLRKKDLITPVDNIFDKEVLDRLNKSAKELIIKSKTPSQILKQLQASQEYIRN